VGITLYALSWGESAHAIFCVDRIVGWIRNQGSTASESNVDEDPDEIPTLTGLILRPDLAPPDGMLILANGVILPETARPSDWYTQARYHHPPFGSDPACAGIPLCSRKAVFSSRTAGNGATGMENFTRLATAFSNRITDAENPELLRQTLAAVEIQLRVASLRHLLQHELNLPRNPLSKQLLERALKVTNLSDLKKRIASLAAKREDRNDLLQAIEALKQKWKRSDYYDAMMASDRARFTTLGEDLENSYDNDFRAPVAFRWVDRSGISVDIHTRWTGNFEVRPNGEIKILGTVLQGGEYRPLNGQSQYLIAVHPPASGGTATLQMIDGIYAQFALAAGDME